MKRGLKVGVPLNHAYLGQRVAAIAPMKRGLKDKCRCRHGIKTNVAAIAPMKRGLKGTCRLQLTYYL